MEWVDESGQCSATGGRKIAMNINGFWLSRYYVFNFSLNFGSNVSSLLTDIKLVIISSGVIVLVGA